MRNKARSSGQLRAFRGSLDASFTLSVLIGLRNGARPLFLRNEATVLLQLTQSTERFVEAALGGGGYALDGVHMRDYEAIAVEQVRFEGAGATQTPELFGHFVDEHFFSGVRGLVFGTEVGFERIERSGLFVRTRDEPGGETVFKGIYGHASRASHGTVQRHQQIGCILLKKKDELFFTAHETGANRA